MRNKQVKNISFYGNLLSRIWTCTPIEMKQGPYSVTRLLFICYNMASLTEVISDHIPVWKSTITKRTDAKHKASSVRFLQKACL